MMVPCVVTLVWQASDATREDSPLFFWVYLIVWLGSFPVAGYLGWPLARAALAAVSPQPERYTSRDDWWVRDGFVRATAIFSLTVAVGMVFLVIPGLMVLMIYTFFPFLILDRKAAGFGALAASSELTQGNRIRLLTVVLLLAVLFIPAAAVFVLWTPGFWGVLAAWVLGTPVLAVGAATVAVAYQEFSNFR